MDNMEEAVRHACDALVPPLLLASPSGWRHVYDGEDPGVAAERAAAVGHWVEETAPQELQKLSELLDRMTRRNGEGAANDTAAGDSGATPASLPLSLRVHVAATAARFVSPRRKARHSAYSLEKWAHQERDLWTSPQNGSLARGILLHPALSASASANAEQQTQIMDSDVAVHLLQQYIRPLFSATQSSKVNAETGRAAPPIANLVDETNRRGAPLDDEVLWKGGDVKSAKRTRVFERLVLREYAGGAHRSGSSSSNHIADRHEALGCTSVLYVCCLSIQHAAREAAKSPQGIDHWMDVWPLVLPPLMQLLEDPSPRFRLLGTQILTEAILGAGMMKAIVDDAEAQSRYLQRMSTLLLRTGVAGIFASVLEANVTHVSHDLAGALLQATTSTWIQLTMLTTDAMYDDTASAAPSTSAWPHMPNVKRDQGRARYDRLCKLLDEGVLRTWAYAPTGIRADDILEYEGGTSSIQGTNDEDGNAASTAALEEDDIIAATMAALERLAAPDLLGIGTVRYLDVCLEYLLQQLVGSLAAKVDRWKQKRPGLQPAVPALDLRREFLVATTIMSMLHAAKPCPGLKTWLARCLSAVVKSWTLIDEVESKSVGYFGTRLLHALDHIVDALSTAQPETFDMVAKRLAAMCGSGLAARLKMSADEKE